MKFKSALCKQRSFFTKLSKVSFAISEMIAKSSRPFHEKGFLGYLLLLQGLLQCLEVHTYANNFSHMKVNKSVLRSRLADEHLQATLRYWFLLLNSSLIIIGALVYAKRCQLSNKS